MEAKESYNLPSANGEPGKPVGIIWSESKILRTRGDDVQGQVKMEVPAQAKKENLSFLYVFAPLRP